VNGYKISVTAELNFPSHSPFFDCSNCLFPFLFAIAFPNGNRLLRNSLSILETRVTDEIDPDRSFSENHHRCLGKVPLLFLIIVFLASDHKIGRSRGPFAAFKENQKIHHINI
jgi:hypothetical protein